MPQVRIASWNIEKNGQSSDLGKQVKVSDFIDICCSRDKGLEIEIVFLCEVHSARLEEYKSFLNDVYGDRYRVEALDGGYSNAYVFLVRNDLYSALSYDKLKYLNRSMFVCHINNEIAIGLAHFKSGQTGLTKSQIEDAASFLQGFTNNTGCWAIAGDMNWDYHRANELTMPPGAQASTCWNDMSQNKGGILDWCAAGTRVQIIAVDGPDFFAQPFQTMDGPDHRPVMFALNY